MKDPNDFQVGGTHYKSNYEHWDFVYDVLGGDYLEGNAVKYLTRWRQKGGIEDIQKASHYMMKVATRYRDGRCEPRKQLSDHGELLLEKFQHANNIAGTRTGNLIKLIAMWSTSADLLHIAKEFQQLLSQVRADLVFAPL